MTFAVEGDDGGEVLRDGMREKRNLDGRGYWSQDFFLREKGGGGGGVWSVC